MVSIIIIMQLNKEKGKSRQPTQKEKRDLKNKKGRTRLKRYE